MPYVASEMSRIPPPLFAWLAAAVLAGGRCALAESDEAGTNGASSYTPVHLNPVLYLPAQQEGRQLKKFADQYTAPPQIFSAPPPPQLMVVDPAVANQSPAQLQSRRKQADDQKNWMLLTPEEILGIKDDSKGPDDPEQNLSAEERYLKRLERSRMVTNNFPARSSLFENDWRKGSSLDDQFRQGNIWSRSAASYYSRTAPFNPLAPKAESNDNADHQLNPAGTPSPWASAWALPGDNPKPDPARVAEMERFRQILNPPEAPVVKPPDPFTGGTAREADPLFATPTAANPWGHGYAPLKDNVGRPVKPTLFTVPTTPVVSPGLHPSPPPWLDQPSILHF